MNKYLVLPASKVLNYLKDLYRLMQNKPEQDIKKVIHYFCFPLIIGLGVSSVRSGFQILMEIEKHVPFFAGILLYFLIRKLKSRYFKKYLGQNDEIIQTLYHELRHCIPAMIGGRKVIEVKATVTPYNINNGTCQTGHVAYGGPVVSSLQDLYSRLSPFYLPLTIIPLLAFRLIVSNIYQPILDIMIGIAFCYYIINHITYLRKGVEVAKIDRKGGSDLAVHGLIFSVTLVILANLIIFPAIILSLHQGWLEAGKHCISGLTFWVNLIIDL